MSRSLRSGWACTVAAGSIALSAFAAAPAARTTGLTVLYAFCSQASCSDGSNPGAGLILDAAGNLYGTTYAGGNNGCTNNAGCGTVFKITAKNVESVLYAFTGAADGANPTDSLVMDASNNLYGTTTGGTTDGFGNVFKLAPNGVESSLYNFTGGSDGGMPYAGVIADAQGNLYGTAVLGGDVENFYCNSGCGVVYEISPVGTETLIHTFQYDGGKDGAYPYGGLMMDKQGDLYGTTRGDHLVAGDGNVFEIASNGTYTQLFSFYQQSGAHSYAGVISVGKNLYGTTSGGALYRAGTVFKITGSGKHTIIYTFTGGSDGGVPLGPLVADKSGNLYSTTEQGGAYGYGTIFKITPTGAESVVWSFTGGADGANPMGGLIASKGYFYGTTSAGGQNGGGTVFKIPE